MMMCIGFGSSASHAVDVVPKPTTSASSPLDLGTPQHVSSATRPKHLYD